MNDFHHTPVLLKETIEALNIREGGKYIDGTLGAAGHTTEIVKKGGQVLAIDKDKDAIDNAQKLKDKVVLVRSSFANIKKIARENNFEDVNGILLDLGVSSHQLDTPEKGFSYRFDAPLDMRMDVRDAKNAQDIVNSYSEQELEDIFSRFGELENAHEIARLIVESRKAKKITTTNELVNTLSKSMSLDPSTKSRIFQALRIETNDEINTLKTTLSDAFDLLDVNGRLCIISFHSLEDRIVKEFGRKVEREGKGKVITTKPVTPTLEEVKQNRRSKSSKLRVIEKQ